MKLLLPLILVTALFAARNFKLYLKDGTYHITSEYKQESDRVRFYSVERGEWEEIPTEFVDIARTKKEVSDRAEKEQEQDKLIKEEETADRELRIEAGKVPDEPGLYYVDGKNILPIKVAESKVHNLSTKKRTMLKIITPIPAITDKAQVELDGEKSSFEVKSGLPEFYFRLAQPERFGILKLTAGKGVRIVEKITIVPVSKEMIEEREQVEVFRRQAGDELYKIWPMEPLPPGEYAAVQFTEGKVNMQVWDFRVVAAGK